MACASRLVTNMLSVPLVIVLINDDDNTKITMLQAYNIKVVEPLDIRSIIFIDIHTWTQTRRHSDAHTSLSHVDTHSHTCTQTHAHTLARRHTLTHLHADTLTHVHADTYSHTHTLARRHTHTLARRHILTHSHTNTQTHTHTLTHLHADAR
jgi:hypothetical protein